MSLKIELCFVYDYLLTECVNISVNCTVVVVETEYSKKRIEKEKETTSFNGGLQSRVRDGPGAWLKTTCRR